MKLKLHDYKLWLFDLDGLLVDTEPLHLQAYKHVCEKYGHQLSWNLEQFIQVAHKSSSAIKEELYSLFPSLQDIAWEDFYKGKKQSYNEVVAETQVDLMPDVDLILELADQMGARTCVVTHSVNEHVQLIRQKQPILNRIKNWITKDDYERPKPDPQAYKKAINEHKLPHERAIGFEDSARGLMALMGSSALPILVTEHEYPQLNAYRDRFFRFKNFMDLIHSQENLPQMFEMFLEGREP